MSLDSNTKLGPYEVIAPVGAGGMGEVYRARDARLNREVAIKMLPDAVVSDPERLRRFETEARTAGMLNHPNLLSVFDIGDYNGAPYIVTELLQGETLREKLCLGPLPPRAAIEYGIQIAHGLAAAHEQGVVHRDLKPENIFICRDDRVKILDFGLAKLVHGESALSAATSATMPAKTEPGVVLGTLGYMSPEQVRGQEADSRSDVFAFGAVLYEMLSGKHAFRGVTSADTISAILTQDPPDLTETNRSINPALEHIVRHCLEKNPDRRFQASLDVAFDLQLLTVTASSGKVAQAVEVAALSRRRRFLSVTGVAVVALVLLAIMYWLGRAGSRGAPEFSRLTFRRGTIRNARFTPDGQNVIYGAAWDGKPYELFSTRPGNPESRTLGVSDADILAVSAAGELAVLLRPKTLQLAYNGILATMPAQGGAPREMLEDVASADWLPDGTGLAVVVTPSVGVTSEVQFPMGHRVYRTEDGWFSHLRVAPDGSRVAFLEHPSYGDDASVVTVDRSGVAKKLATGWITGQGLAWSHDSKEIWFSATRKGASRAVYAVTLSGNERLVTAVAGNMTLEDVTRDGKLLFVRSDDSAGIIGVAPGATKERDLSWFDWSLARDLSADGKTLIFEEGGEAAGSAYAIYMRGTDGSPAVRLALGGASRLSPDGKWVSATTLGNHPHLVLLPTGPGQPLTINTGNLEASSFRSAWMPDDRALLFIAAEPGHKPRTYQVAVAGGIPKPVTPEGITGLLLSPDGSELVARNGDGDFILFNLRQATFKPLARLLKEWVPVTWSPDGKWLFVRQGTVPVHVVKFNVATGDVKPWRDFLPNDPAGITDILNIVVTPDERTSVYTYYRQSSTLYLETVR